MSTAMGASDPAQAGVPIRDRRFPPVGTLATVSLALVVCGGIIMASYYPRPAPMALPWTFASLAVVLMIVCVLMLARLKDFAWPRFAVVYRWALLAYAISAGMIGFAFVKDGTRGSSLIVLAIMLVVFATAVPLTIAFTVARYTDPSGDDGA